MTDDNHSLFHRLRGHVQRLIEANGGSEEVFNGALEKLDKVFKSQGPGAAITLAAQQIVEFLDHGYAVQQQKLDAEVETLETAQRSSDSPSSP